MGPKLQEEGSEDLLAYSCMGAARGLLQVLNRPLNLYEVIESETPKTQLILECRATYEAGLGVLGIWSLGPKV